MGELGYKGARIQNLGEGKDKRSIPGSLYRYKPQSIVVFVCLIDVKIHTDVLKIFTFSLISQSLI